MSVHHHSTIGTDCQITQTDKFNLSVCVMFGLPVTRCPYNYRYYTPCKILYCESVNTLENMLTEENSDILNVSRPIIQRNAVLKHSKILFSKDVMRKIKHTRDHLSFLHFNFLYNSKHFSRFFLTFDMQ